MCDECLTARIRTLVEPTETDSHYYTLRVGDALGGHSGVLIVGPQEVIARFEFIEDMSDELEMAILVVVDAVDWVFFLPAYARALGKSEEDYYEIVEQLEKEAYSLKPRIAELTPEW